MKPESYFTNIDDAAPTAVGGFNPGTFTALVGAKVLGGARFGELALLPTGAAVPIGSTVSVDVTFETSPLLAGPYVPLGDYNQSTVFDTVELYDNVGGAGALSGAPAGINGVAVGIDDIGSHLGYVRALVRYNSTGTASTITAVAAVTRFSSVLTSVTQSPFTESDF